MRFPGGVLFGGLRLEERQVLVSLWFGSTLRKRFHDLVDMEPRTLRGLWLMRSKTHWSCPVLNISLRIMEWSV